MIFDAAVCISAFPQRHKSIDKLANNLGWDIVIIDNMIGTQLSQEEQDKLWGKQFHLDLTPPLKRIPYQAACSFGHLRVIRYMLEHGYDTMAIFEDDAYTFDLGCNLNTYIEIGWQDVPADWDIVYLGTLYYSPPYDTITPRIAQCGKQAGTHGYILNRKSAIKILEKFWSCFGCVNIDGAYGSMIQSKYLKSYLYTPPIIGQERVCKWNTFDIRTKFLSQHVV